MKFLLVLAWELLHLVGQWIFVVGVYWVGMRLGGQFLPGKWQMSKFSASGGTFPTSLSRKNLALPLPLIAIWKTLRTGANRLTHLYKHIITPPVRCSQHLSVSHGMNNLKIYFIDFHNVFAFQKLLFCRSHVSVD